MEGAAVLKFEWAKRYWLSLRFWRITSGLDELDEKALSTYDIIMFSHLWRLVNSQCIT